MTAIQKLRIKKELARLTQNPPEGISCYAKDDKLDILTAVIIGPQGTPYEGGLFKLEVNISEKYPFEPPIVKFLTPVYHPNIDTTGLICLDLLKMPPKGGWNPTISLENLLTAIQLLLGNPNPDDPLMTEIAQEFKYNKPEFERKAKMFMVSNANSKNL